MLELRALLPAKPTAQRYQRSIYSLCTHGSHIWFGDFLEEEIDTCCDIFVWHFFGMCIFGLTVSAYLTLLDRRNNPFQSIYYSRSIYDKLGNMVCTRIKHRDNRCKSPSLSTSSAKDPTAHLWKDAG
jgi:hypothetical protein